MTECSYCHKKYSSKPHVIRHMQSCTVRMRRLRKAKKTHCPDDTKEEILKELKAWVVQQGVFSDTNNLKEDNTDEIDNSTDILFITKKVNLLDILTSMYKDDDAAFGFLRERLYRDMGDIDLFSKIYMKTRDPKTWAFSCLDKKKKLFLIKQAGDPIIDPGGETLYHRFKNNYLDTLLYLINKEIAKVFSLPENTKEREEAVDYLFDSFDLLKMQEKALTISKQQNSKKFIKGIIERIEALELAYST